ncbi:MAG: DUF4827 domain-containing protein [Tannerella sp.]|jgi:hypothetical protein|nr:DUF4827 domain-containing protein [Tannerella sp.]
MKKGFYVLVLVSCVTHLLSVVSCNKYPTYEELKSDELKVIKRILDTKGIEVITEYPANGVFEENQFVQLNSGIYLHVVDSGTGRRAQAGASGTTEVLVRLKAEYTYADSLYQYDTFQNGYDPFYFKYGSALSVVSANGTSYNQYYMLFSIGLESILSYVGDSAVVKLIIPGYSEINNYPAGSTMQSSDRTKYVPIYYDKVRYTFY